MDAARACATNRGRPPTASRSPQHEWGTTVGVGVTDRGPRVTAGRVLPPDSNAIRVETPD